VALKLIIKRNEFLDRAMVRQQNSNNEMHKCYGSEMWVGMYRGNIVLGR